MNINPLKNKLILSIIIIIVITAGVIFAFNSGFLNFSSYENPKIITFITTSKITSEAPSDNAKIFHQGDSIYLYFEFGDIIHEGQVDIYEEITVKNSITYHSDSVDYIPISDQSENITFKDSYSFDTSTSWPAGRYTATIMLRDDMSGLTTSKDVDFILIKKGNSIPSVSLYVSPRVGNAPLDVSFTGVPNDFIGSTHSYSWDFGDGTYSTLENPQHTFSNEGVFPITLVVTDEYNISFAGISSVTVGSTDSDIVNAYIETDPASPNCGELIQFYGSAYGGNGEYVSYEWDFNDDDIIDSTEQNPSHTFPVGESYYKVTLIVTDSASHVGETHEFIYCT